MLHLSGDNMLCAKMLVPIIVYISSMLVPIIFNISILARDNTFYDHLHDEMRRFSSS